VSASSFGIVSVAISGHAGAPGGPAATRASGAQAGTAQTARAHTSAVSGTVKQECKQVQPSIGSSTGSGSGSGSSSSTGSPSSSPTGSGTTPPSPNPGKSTTLAPSVIPDPSSSPSGTSPTPSDTTGSADTTGLISPLISGLTAGSAKQSASTNAFVTSDDHGASAAATLLSFTRTDASSTPVDLCVSLQSDEASITRGQTAQWDVSVWATGGNVSDVKLQLSTSPSSQKPAFSFGCGTNRTASCNIRTVYSGSQHTQLQAHVPVAKTATSVKSVQLTVTGSGTGVNPNPAASVPIAVTAPRPAASTSGSSKDSTPPPSVGTTVPQPSGVASSLPVGGLPFLNGSGSALSPGGNASSLFPSLNPSTGSLPTVPGHGSPRTRPVAETLPADASLEGAQYAGLGALALAFVLSVTRLSIRRRHASKPGSGS
jgi:hypothetical protein